MSSIARSGPVPPTVPRAPKGSEARFQRLRFFFAILRARPSFAVGYGIVATVVVIALLAPWLAPYGPMTADPSVYLLPPGGNHLLGTDGTGMDIFSRVLFAPRIDLALAIVGTFVSATIGGGVGALVGYYEDQQTWRRAVSTMVMRSADVRRDLIAGITSHKKNRSTRQKARIIVAKEASFPAFRRCLPARKLFNRRVRPSRLLSVNPTISAVTATDNSMLIEMRSARLVELKPSISRSLSSAIN